MTGPGSAPPGLVATAAHRFRQQAAATPDSVAVEAGDSSYSYAQLCAWVDELARRLTAAGPERVIGVAIARSPAQVAAVLAVLSTRSVYLPLDVEAPRARTRLILDDAAPVLLLHDEAARSLAEAVGAPPGLAIGPTPGPDRAPTGAGCQPFADPGQPAYLMYTSGSTGRPKGVLMCAGALDNLLSWHLSELAPGPSRRVAQFTATGFDIWVQEVLTTLVSGATLVIPSSDTCRDPARLARWLGARRITDLFCPNVMVEAVCRAALAQALTLPELAHIAQAGEQLTLGADVRTFFRIRPGRRLHNHYGPTETHAATSCVLPAEPADWPDRAGIGRPIRRTRVHLLDQELRELPDGAAGEVYVSGAALARGYRGRPGLTADRFLPCPFGEPGERMYRTGDLARRLPDGQLVYLGRSDQQVKIRGVRVELGEVDAAIRAQPEVRDVALVARGEGSGQHLDCYLVAAPGVSDVVARVRTALADTVLPEMVPASFTVLPALPTNSNGKVDRNALVPPVTDRTGSPTARDDPAGPAPSGVDQASALARLFAECLELDRVDEDDDFFALGGHSLSAAKLTARVRAVLGHELSISDVFGNPTVAKLRRSLRNRERAFPPVLAVGGDGQRPASFAQDRLWVIDQFSGPSELYNVPIVLRLHGEVEVGALRAAVRDVLRRHEVLRSRLVLGPAGLCQEVLPMEAAFTFETVMIDPDEQEAGILRAASRPFDLGSEAPVRSTLFSTGTNCHTLLLLVHHAVIDGWSVKPLLKDLGFAYASRHAGLPPPWGPLPVQYGDYAVWQRAQFGADQPLAEHRRQVDYWRTRLAGAPQVLAAATDRPRPEELSSAGDRVPVRFDRVLHRAVRAAAQELGCTAFMMTHAALCMLLWLRGAGDDVVIGATVAGRLDGALDDLVGLFVNTLALRVDLSGDPTVSESLMRVRRADLGALAAQELPFDLVVEALNPHRSMSASPIVQVMLAFQTGRPEFPAIAGSTVEVEVIGLAVAKFDLTFELTELTDPADSGPGGIVGHLEFATDLYDRATALVLVDELGSLLRVLAEQPARRLGELRRSACSAGGVSTGADGARPGEG